MTIPLPGWRWYLFTAQGRDGAYSYHVPAPSEADAKAVMDEEVPRAEYAGILAEEWPCTGRPR